MTLHGVARELSSRLASIFLADGNGRRPCHADDARYKDDPHWKELLLFYEYFHGESGRGIGASHQTGWTATVAKFVEDLAKRRESGYSFDPAKREGEREMMPISFDATVTHGLEQAASGEWLEANGLGGWASGTIAGCHTRRYHGLLVAATRPPVGRMVLLSKLAETVIDGDGRFELDTNRYHGAVHPRGHELLSSFTLDPFPTFVYEAGGVTLKKTIAAIHGENTTVVLYDVLEAPAAFTLELRSLIAIRDVHALQRAAAAPLRHRVVQGRRVSCRPYDGTPELFVQLAAAGFEAKPDWYFGSSRRRARAGSTRTRICFATARSAASSPRAAASA
jgi:hypothetical protein